MLLKERHSELYLIVQSSVTVSSNSFLVLSGNTSGIKFLKRIKVGQVAYKSRLSNLEKPKKYLARLQFIVPAALWAVISGPGVAHPSTDQV